LNDPVDSGNVKSTCSHVRAEQNAFVSITCISYEEEDTCHMRRRIHGCRAECLCQHYLHFILGGGYMSYEEEDTWVQSRMPLSALPAFHMRRRIHVI